MKGDGDVGEDEGSAFPDVDALGYATEDEDDCRYD